MPSMYWVVLVVVMNRIRLRISIARCLNQVRQPTRHFRRALTNQETPDEDGTKRIIEVVSIIRPRALAPHAPLNTPA